MKLFDICKVVGLEKNAALNDTYVEIHIEPQQRSAPTADGVLEGMWAGVAWLGNERTGFLQTKNLKPVVAHEDPEYPSTRRAIFIHLTGWEER